MSTRKRSSRVVEEDSGDAEPSLLNRLHNMWQFANLCQWIYIFGKAAKIDESLEVEDIEAECLKPHSTVLRDIALALLKIVSSHRGLTHEIFDEQARKQYIAKAPERNPFGDEDDALKFDDFDIFTKIRVLQQFTRWVMMYPERIREKMEEQKDSEQTNWRIEPYGWDAEDRTYFVLDDNRVYRLTEPPPQPTAKSKKSKASRTARRSSKRRRTVTPEDEQQTPGESGSQDETTKDEDLGGMTWECLAVTLGEVRVLIEGFHKTRDENEKILRKQLEVHLLPILEKQEESRKRKEIQRERELQNLAKMTNAKRSNRLAKKAELQKQDEQEREEEHQRLEADIRNRREEAARLKAEKEREARLYSRAKRLREREARRLQHEEELAQLSEDNRATTNGNERISERRRQIEIQRNKQALKELEEDEEDWVFDCSCGLYGQVDDGAHSVACERCNIWQHSKCLGISEQDAERPEFQFICASCRHREEELNRPRPTIKLKVNNQSDATVKLQSDKTAANTLSGDVPPSNSAPGLPELQGPQDGTTNPLFSAPALVHPQGVGLGLRPNPLAPELMPTISHSSSSQSPVKFSTSGQPTRDVSNRDADGSDSHQQVATPMSSTSPSNGNFGIQAGQSFESTLSTPEISREIYRAAHFENGTLPAQAGISPVKHSSPRIPEPPSASKISTVAPIIPPVASLSPSPQYQDLTPPLKQPDFGRPQNGQ